MSATKKMSRDEKKDAIVLAAAPHVAFDGWGEAALAAGAEDAGFDAKTAKRLFPEGAVDAIAHFATISDREMIKAMQAADLDGMRVRDRVIFGVRARLEFLIPYREAVRGGLGVLANPLHAGLMARITHTTVDHIWYQAGDRSADFNYYTKRGLLAAVYGPTVLYWLNDQSDNCEDTWDFLARRIDDVLKIPPMKAKVMNALDNFIKGGPFARFNSDLQMRP
ncbi:COQ9 family protein [Magnetovibrio sp.]|uniref:COQ9 family protein n=1 Tax=Magnetovibrio sp. TaxID=2024836 RepID=UPI002F9445BE